MRSDSALAYARGGEARIDFQQALAETEQCVPGVHALAHEGAPDAARLSSGC
jgi:hypothetical protein